jgi:hypothetical protein
MRLTNDGALIGPPQSSFDQAGARAPWLWYDIATVDGALYPWANAPVLSLYWLLDATTPKVYIKTAANSVTADWKVLVSASATGDLTIAGTLYAGDVVVMT